MAGFNRPLNEDGGEGVLSSPEDELNRCVELQVAEDQQIEVQKTRNLIIALTVSSLVLVLVAVATLSLLLWLRKRRNGEESKLDQNMDQNMTQCMLK